MLWAELAMKYNSAHSIGKEDKCTKIKGAHEHCKRDHFNCQKSQDIVSL
jgi:hypothetical protein